MRHRIEAPTSADAQGIRAKGRDDLGGGPESVAPVCRKAGVPRGADTTAAPGSVEAWVIRTCRQQRVQTRVTDPNAVASVASLFGRHDGDKRSDRALR
jgi:hypothetical protein